MKKLITVILSIIMVQAGIYVYLDRVLLAPSVKFSQQSVSGSGQSQADARVASTDGAYYVEQNATGVRFVTAAGRSVKVMPLQSGETVTYATWVPNTHLALLGISSPTAQGVTVTLKPVNLDTDSHPIEPTITGLPKNSQITDVAFSAQVNVTYILVRCQQATRVYRTDANNHLRQVSVGSTVRRIASLQSVDMLVFDSVEQHAVYSQSGNGTRNRISPAGGSYALIGTDQSERVYIGKLTNSGLVSEVLVGSKQGNFASLKVLSYPLPLASVTVSYDGSLRFS